MIIYVRYATHQKIYLALLKINGLDIISNLCHYTKMANILNIQFSPIIGNKTENLKRIEKFIFENANKNLDLIVMPEFFSTAVENKINITEPSCGGEVINFLSEIAKKYNTNIICGTVLEKEGEKIYNTSFALDRKGEILGKYRKIHLFRFFGGQEHKSTTSGDKEIVIDFDFAKVGLSICFDIKYPLHFKKLIKMGAEIIVSPSAWLLPESINQKEKEIFINTWKATNICRASESLVYFVSSNLAGKPISGFDAIGNSMITAPSGEVISQADEKETVLFANLDMNIVRELKKAVPIYKID